MASIVRDRRRGTYLIQWFDGRKWRRATVLKSPGWKQGRSTFPARDPLPVTQALAEFAEKERRARRGRPMDPGKTVAAFLAEYQDVYARERAPGSVGELAKAVRQFLPWCQQAKLTRVAAVTPAACQQFLDARAGQTSQKTGQPISPARLAQERALLSGAWRRAVRLRELAENPWTATEAPGRDRDRKTRKRRPSWSPEEFAGLLTAAKPWLRDLLILGTQTGIRISALLALEWRDVHWPKGQGGGFGEIEVRPELDKTGKGYRVPISHRAHETLARRLASPGAHPTRVLTSARGLPTRISTTATAIIRACNRAGLPVPKSPNHHMRRSFGRWAVLGYLTGRPVPLYVISRWFGHHSVKMTEEYLDIRTEESHDWMAEAPSSEGQASGGQ